MLLFAHSRARKMHLKNQCALIVRGKGNVLEIKAFAVRRRAFPSRGTLGKPST